MDRHDGAKRYSRRKSMGRGSGSDLGYPQREVHFAETDAKVRRGSERERAIALTLLRSVALKRECLKRYIGFLLLTSPSPTSMFDVRCSMFGVRRSAFGPSNR